MKSYFENAVFIREELRRLDEERKRPLGDFPEEDREQERERKCIVFACGMLQKLLFDCERNGREKPGAPQRDAELLYRMLIIFFDER